MIVKHQDWEKIRRPHRIMKYRYPRKERTTTQLVRKLSGRVLKALYNGSAASATGGTDVPEQGHRTTCTPNKLVHENSLEPLPPRLRLGLHQNVPIEPILVGGPAPASSNTATQGVRDLGKIGREGQRPKPGGRGPFIGVREIIETQP